MSGRLLVALACLVLGGCMVGPKYSKPAVPAAPAYQEQPPANFTEVKGWTQAKPGDASLRAAWWELFRIPELNRLEQEVDPSNQTLKVSEARFRQARALIQVNRSQLYPTVSTGPTVTGNQLSSNRALGTPQGAPYSDLSLPVDFPYEVDLWGRIRRSVTAARERAQASAADMETVRLSLHAELALDYFDLRSLDAQKQILDETLVAYQKSLDLTQNRFDGGLASGAEVAQARTQLETTNVQDIEVGVQRAQFEHAIAVLIGTTPESFHIAVQPLTSQPPDIPVGLPSELLERRPDIAEAERAMAAANEQIGIARAAFFPTLLLTAAGGMEGGSFVNWFAWPSRFWAIGPSTLETAFDAGRRRATQESAQAGYDSAVATYQQNALTAFQQVEDNLSSLRILEKEAGAARAAVEAAQHSLDLSLARYRGGLVTYLEVATAQTILLQNERAEVDLQRRRMETSVLLIKALGGGWDVSKLPKT